MVKRRVIAGILAASAFAGVCAIAPAMGANDGRVDPRKTVEPVRLGIGSFTPASADPRLAAVLARAGVSDSSFRFTPSGANQAESRAVTVAVRARTNRPAVTADRLPNPSSPVALTPLAYNLGVAVGWKRFALSGDLSKVDLAGQPGSRESSEVGVSYTGKAFSGRVKAAADRPLPNQPRLVTDQPSYSIDVGGSYRLTRNLDVTAGVRYKSERDRLPQLNDDRRDSQSVYVGTALRF
ncbi:hypothetical protein [Sphingomonas sp.]|uniref:hypothetical protein n=1 Tax=Sphingomonas sp. TaxID=28214 RepID=UPI002BEAACB5|nr:hypothetical protein [Sphingomonas sp.]HWK37213.1 hypothetical protein [Sphingomonas sp.]